MSKIFSFSALLMLPIAVFAPKAETLLLLSLTPFLLFSLNKKDLIVSLTRPFWIKALYAIIIYGAISVIWTNEQFDALKLILSLLILFSLSSILFYQSGRLDKSAKLFFCNSITVGYLLGLIFFFVELFFEFPIFRWVLGLPKSGPNSPDVGILGPAFSVLMLMFWPVIFVIWSKNRLLAGSMILLVIILSLNGNNLASFFCFIFSSSIFLIARIWGRVFSILITSLTAIFILSSPFIASSLNPNVFTENLSDNYRSTLHRLYIWEFTAEKISEKPILGWGIDSSRSIPGSDREVLPSGEILSLHPHNAALQIWLELGIIGASIFSLIIMYLGFSIASISDNYMRATALSTLYSALTFSFLSFGIWQNWWISSLILTALFVRILVTSTHENL